MPNEKQILGYVSSNTTHWSLLEEKGPIECDGDVVRSTFCLQNTSKLPLTL